MAAQNRHHLPSASELTIDIRAVHAGEGTNKVAGVSGVVKEVEGSSLTEYQAGDEVLASIVLERRAGLITSTETVNVETSFVCRKPAGVSFQDAASLPTALVGVQAALHELCSRESQWDLDSGSRNATPAILITGSETLIGTVLVKVLHERLPLAHRYSTCSGPDDDGLGKLVCRLVPLGAIYAIDAEALELLKHLRAASEQYNGPEGKGAIIDVVGLVARRPELRDLLIGQKLFFDLEVQCAEERRLEPLLNAVKNLAAYAEALGEVAGTMRGVDDTVEEVM
ncbi:hypothetical protein LTR78_004571 [Recurvomyces mirabilis]|uniref:Uncharacterized protein n=1 Tax=Recurvomyces mirabilis TaxID=574656 RepID=A0AAE1C2H7_9PEZI|nr:hypothetical protein LTR78_004571 [Recurvomyces mirabilis]KAK5152935.1 hypothetical protein LTS14_008043 [Recurvomyces mirabilis]